MNSTENVARLFEQLEILFQAKTVIGDPIIISDVTLIPLTGIYFGAAGNGGDDGPDKKRGEASSGVSGAGGKITPMAIIVVKGNEVNLLHLNSKNTKSTIDTVIEKFPEILAKIKDAQTLENMVSKHT